jgi:hypothetical protein
MNTRAIELTEIKRDLANLPANKLAEVREYIRKLLPKSQEKKEVQSLEGIWAGLGWEKIEDLEGEIRKLRKESSEAILKKFQG